MRTRSGWTLLEMMLALALTTLLLSAIYNAMHIFYTGVNTTRSNVERDQLARTVLRRVSDDLRSAVRYMPADTSGLSGAASGGLADAAAALGAATGSTGSSGSTPSVPSSTGSTGSGSSSSGSTGSSSSSDSSDTSTESTDTTTAPPIPGVYGNSTFLQIDICRLPRPDEIAANASRGMPTSEVRTVSYSMGTGDDPNGLPALIRTEQSRAAALYGSTNGTSIDPTSSNTQVLAAEVASVEFLYFDGTEWLPEWDSTAMGSVPLAIDVRVMMRTPDQQAVADEGLVAATAADAVLVDPSSVFRLVVHLPAALTPAGASSSSSMTTEDPAAAAASAATTPSTPTSGAGSSSSSDSSTGSQGGGGSGKGGGGGGSGGTKGGGGGGGPGGGGPGGGGPGGGTGGTGGTDGGGGAPTPPPTPPADPTMMP